MSLFFRVSGIVLTLMMFLGCGVLIGARRPAISDPQRFISTGKPGFAFDTKLGLECDMDGVEVHPPPGFVLDKDLSVPRCVTLAER